MDWKKILKLEQAKSAGKQQANKKKIIAAFKEMWNTNPTEKVFADYTSGLVIFPEMIYVMVSRIKWYQKLLR